MNPMIDTAMLKHHRVDYAPQIDTDPAQGAGNSGRTALVIVIAVTVLAPFGMLAALVA